MMIVNELVISGPQRSGRSTLLKDCCLAKAAQGMKVVIVHPTSNHARFAKSRLPDLPENVDVVGFHDLMQRTRKQILEYDVFAFDDVEKYPVAEGSVIELVKHCFSFAPSKHAWMISALTTDTPT